ncbi:MAG: hypothetical protein Q8K75_01815 [Chlamydiales bacterium]|nr:hypothetical protein [Chlamydiales bacterium]
MEPTISARHPPACVTSPRPMNTLFEDLNILYQRCKEKEQPLETAELEQVQAYARQLLPMLGGECLPNLITTLDEYDSCCLGFALKYGCDEQLKTCFMSNLEVYIQNYGAGNVKKLGSFLLFCSVFLPTQDYCKALVTCLTKPDLTEETTLFVKLYIQHRARQWQRLHSSSIKSHLKTLMKAATPLLAEKDILDQFKHYTRLRHLSRYKHRTSSVLTSNLCVSLTDEQWVVVRNKLLQSGNLPYTRFLAGLHRTQVGRSRSNELVKECLKINPLPLNSLIQLTSYMDEDSEILWHQVCEQIVKKNPYLLFHHRDTGDTYECPSIEQLEIFSFYLKQEHIIQILNDTRWLDEKYSDLRAILPGAIMIFPLDNSKKILLKDNVLNCLLAATLYWAEKNWEHMLDFWLPQLTDLGQTYILAKLRYLGGRNDLTLRRLGLNRELIGRLTDRIIYGKDSL